MSNIAYPGGTVNEHAFVDDANGGSDGKKFAALRTGYGDLSSLNALTLDTLDSAILLVQTLELGNSDLSEVFGKLVGETHYSTFQDIRDLAVGFKTSLETPGALTVVTIDGLQRFKIDLTGLMAHLPNPQSVSSANPFVISYRGRIEAVAQFFKTMFGRYLTF